MSLQTISALRELHAHFQPSHCRKLQLFPKALFRAQLNMAMFEFKHVEKLFYVVAIELLMLGNAAIDRCPELLSYWIDVFITCVSGDFITVGFSDGKPKELKLFENGFSWLDLNISYLHITDIFNFYNCFKKSEFQWVEAASLCLNEVHFWGNLKITDISVYNFCFMHKCLLF